MTNVLIGAGVVLLAFLTFLCWHGLYFIANHLTDIKTDIKNPIWDTNLKLQALTNELGQIKHILDKTLDKTGRVTSELIEIKDILNRR
jgi:hypothetical protein